jgi:hypothetical protein
MSWDLSQVRWLVRQGASMAVLPWPATCLGCRERAKGGLTTCCGLAICIMCIYGSRPRVCPLCGWAAKRAPAADLRLIRGGAAERHPALEESLL